MMRARQCGFTLAKSAISFIYHSKHSEKALLTLRSATGERLTRWRPWMATAASHASSGPPTVISPVALVDQHRQAVDVSSEEQHRVTALTAFKADALALHLSTHLADLLFLPVEAFFVRSVARTFLSATSNTATMGLSADWRAQVFRRTPWSGWRIGPGGIRSYVTNMALCGVLELTIGMGVRQLSSGVAWLMGRKLFGWGRL